MDAARVAGSLSWESRGCGTSVSLLLAAAEATVNLWRSSALAEFVSGSLRPLDARFYINAHLSSSSFFFDMVLTFT